MNIMTVFSGRRPNMEILCKYLKKALELNIIDEVHFWNNTRNINDENYLKSISHLRRTSSTSSGNYIPITPIITNNSFELNVKASNDIHIQMTDGVMHYEILLGGWNNTKSVIREKNTELGCLNQRGIADKHHYCLFKITIDNVDNVNNINNADIDNANIDNANIDGSSTLFIRKNNELIMVQKLNSCFDLTNAHIRFKTGFQSIGNIKYECDNNKGFYFMDTCEKSWKNYYHYYDDAEFKDDIILKCDDDIVFMDLNKLPRFIEFVKNTKDDLVFANTINNGVSAYYQQNKYNLIPKQLMLLEYPPNGLCGSLWESGQKAERLHNYFIQNYKLFLNYINPEFDTNTKTDTKPNTNPNTNPNNTNTNSICEIIPIKTRFSINFFGFKGKNWYKIKDSGNGDDEYNLTVKYVAKKQFHNVLYSDFYVSHLSFYRQIETGICTSSLINKYNELQRIYFQQYQQV